MFARQCACTRFWNRVHITPLLNATQPINWQLMYAHIPVGMDGRANAHIKPA